MNPVLLGSLAALCWGTLDFLASGTSRSIGAARTTAAVTIAGLALLSLWLAVSGSFPVLAVRGIWLPIVAGAAFALATMWLFTAISSGPISLAVPIVMSYPATTVVVVAAFGKAIDLLQLVLVAVIMAGVLIAAWAEAGDAEQSGKGERRRRTIGFALASHVTFLLAVLAGQHAAPIFGEIESVWISRLAGTVVVLPMLLGGRRATPITPALWSLLLLMGGIDVAALSLLFAAGHTEHPELAVVCASGSGAVTVILAWIVTKEQILPLRWLGIALTFAGIGALSAVK